MAKVICTLPHAADTINGVKFLAHRGGHKISEDITDEQAKHFASIPGYILDEPRPENEGKGKGGKAAASEATS